MQRFLIILSAMLAPLFSYAYTYNYRFNSTPISKALTQLIKDHPEIKVSFIYNELDDYTTTSSVTTDDLKTALKNIVGLNPVTVIEKNGLFFVEAMQRGKYNFSGKIVNEFDEAVPYATIILLQPKDSTVLTFGMSKADGKFFIPCDSKNVIAKISSTGYQTLYLKCRKQSLGSILLKTHTVDLSNITIDADESLLLTDRTVFIPQQRQKNSSMSGIELLERMAIPQLRFNPQTGKPETTTGKSISIFIDNLPASDEDLRGMNIQDVKKVEFLEFPSDPRFQGKPYVVNFIMAKYEYGGYVRLFGNENFIMNSGQIQANARFQYKRMTYDVMGLGFYHDNNHYGSDLTETFRLPQSGGNIMTFNRYSNSSSSKIETRQYFATFKATYKSDNITAQNLLNSGITNKPHIDENGTVNYRPEDYPDSYYSSKSSKLF